MALVDMFNAISGTIKTPPGTSARAPGGLMLAYLACTTLALFGFEARAAEIAALKPLLCVFKPVTTLLLVAFVGHPLDHLRKRVVIGIFLSLIGDVALLWKNDAALTVGVAGFFFAHLFYICAFHHVGRWSSLVAIVAVLFTAATIVLLAVGLPGAKGVKWMAMAVYGTAVTAMVVVAWSTVGVKLAQPWLVAVGATLFYVGDVSIALNKYGVHEIPHSWFLTSGIYWVGQLGIALAARAGVRDDEGRP